MASASRHYDTERHLLKVLPHGRLL